MKIKEGWRGNKGIGISLKGMMFRDLTKEKKRYAQLEKLPSMNMKGEK